MAAACVCVWMVCVCVDGVGALISSLFGRKVCRNSHGDWTNGRCYFRYQLRTVCVVVRQGVAGYSFDPSRARHGCEIPGWNPMVEHWHSILCICHGHEGLSSCQLAETQCIAFLQQYGRVSQQNRANVDAGGWATTHRSLLFHGAVF